MAPRPTKNFVLPDETVIVLKTYLNVREEDEIQNVFMQNADMKQNGNSLEVSGIKATVGKAARDKLLELMIVSIHPAPVNGEEQAAITTTKDILEYIMDMPKTLYSPLEKEINAITDPKDS